VKGVGELWSAGSYATPPADLWAPQHVTRVAVDDRAWWEGPSRQDISLTAAWSGSARGRAPQWAFDQLGSAQGRRELQRLNGLAGEVLLPDPAAMRAITALTDPAAMRDAITAYNEWLGEFCAQDSGHFIGVGQIPTTGIDDAMAELDRCQRLGMPGVSLLHPPAGPGTTPGDADGFWEAAAGRTVVCLTPAFGGTAEAQPKVTAGRAPAVAGFLPRFAFSGIPDRCPSLRLFVANMEAGWLPYVLDIADTNYQRAAASRVVSLASETDLPSQYVRRFTWITFQHDRAGAMNRSFLGEHHLMWSAALPSAASQWPGDEEQAASVCSGMDTAVARRLLADNCRRLFRIGDAPDFTSSEVNEFTVPTFA